MVNVFEGAEGGGVERVAAGWLDTTQISHCSSRLMTWTKKKPSIFGNITKSTSHNLDLLLLVRGPVLKTHSLLEAAHL